MKIYKIAQSFEDVLYSVDDAHEDILREYYSKGRKKGSMMSWSVIPFAPIKKLWNDYAKYGVVRDERGINSIVEQMLKILARLQAATDLSGHSQFKTDELAKELGYKAIGGNNTDFYFDFLETPYGTPISDYGLPKLWKLAEELTTATSSEQKLLILDQMLNVIHPRGDLAALFVEGGSWALSGLSLGDGGEEIRETREKEGEIGEMEKNVASGKVRIYKIAVTDGEFRDAKDSIRSVKDDIRDIKKDIRDFESRMKKIEKKIEDLNFGNRMFSQTQTIFNSLQRKVERFETISQEWRNYKKEMDDNIKKQVEKHTKARISDITPQAF